MNNTVALHTLGCKLNFSETSMIGKEFLNRGYEIVDYKGSADVYVFNTCTVTENAEKECRQLVRRALRNNPDAFIIVTGCYAQLRPEEIVSIDGVDAVLGSNEKFRIFSLLESFDKKNLACIHVSPFSQLDDFGPAHSTDADSRTRAFLKIQDGCDYKCSFCTIPLARGLSRSMQPDQVIADFKNLISNGYKEVILTGVNVGDYGKGFGTDLFRLVLDIIKIEGDFRVRISSIEPNLLTDEIIELTAREEKLCNHFHIPLQSGSPEMLKLMQRRYTADHYAERIHRVRQIIPDAGIGVDVIVGFPGETDEHFEETYNFINELPVSYLHVFTYSERPDTKAVTIPGKVEVGIRRERNNRLRILSHKKKSLFYESQLNKNARVLFESENDNGLIKGFTSNYLRVAHPYNPDLANNFSHVSINGTNGESCSCLLQEDKNSVDLMAS